MRSSNNLEKPKPEIFIALRDTLEAKGLDEGDHVTVKTDEQGLIRLFHTKAPRRAGPVGTTLFPLMPGSKPGSSRGAPPSGPVGPLLAVPKGMGTGTPLVQRRRDHGRPKGVFRGPGTAPGIRVAGHKRGPPKAVPQGLTGGIAGPPPLGDVDHVMDTGEEEEGKKEDEKEEEPHGTKRRKIGNIGESCLNWQFM